jgi:hypothetical protein
VTAVPSCRRVIPVEREREREGESELRSGVYTHEREGERERERQSMRERGHHAGDKAERHRDGLSPAG